MPGIYALLWFVIGLHCVHGNEPSRAISVANAFRPVRNALKGASAAIINTASSIANRFQSAVGHSMVTDVMYGGHRFAEIFGPGGSDADLTCNLLGDRAIIEHLLMLIPKTLVTHVTTQDMDIIVDKCTDRSPEAKGSSLLRFLGKALQSLAIYPGTKWCGAGNIAKNYSDLGMARSVDMCCRDHDHSQDNIPAFGTSHGIENSRFYTIFRMLLLRPPCKKLVEDKSKPKAWSVVYPPNFLEAFINKKKKTVWRRK
ncbi:uncharacterized protein LOC144094633 isoform X2 [Amblyomma americanum]